MFDFTLRQREKLVRLSESQREIIYSLSPDIRRTIYSAKNSTSGTELIRLTREKNYLIRQEVARNPNTPSRVLKELYSSEEFFIMNAVLQNPKIFKSRELTKKSTEYE